MKRRTIWVAAVGGFAAVALLTLGAWGWQVESSASAGRTALTEGMTALKSSDLTTARADFSQAQAEFDRSRALVGPDWVQSIPFIGRQVEAVDQLAEIGSEGSSAAIQVIDLMNASKAGGPDGSVNDIIKVAKPYLLSMLESFNHIAAISPQLSTDGLVPPLADAVTTMQDTLAPLDPVFAQSDALTTMVTYLLDQDHRFMLVSQNNAELRATGGFMGSMGWVKAGPSGLKLEKYQNVYSLPWTSTAHVKRPPGARMGSWKNLAFWDANWWLNFPTSTDTMLTIYDGLTPKQRSVDGVIAIDLVTVKALLAEFGPIELPAFGKTITAKNMLPTLSRLVTQDLATASVDTRKDILRALSEALLTKIMNVTPDRLVPTAQILAQMANEKHLQFSVRDAKAQAALSTLALGATITPPQGMTDQLGVVNVLNWPSKLNFGMHKSVDYQVSLNESGAATTKLALTYVKDKERLLSVGRDWFGGYLRVYRPAGTTLDAASSRRSMKPVNHQQRSADTKPAMASGELGSAAITQGYSVLLGETRTLTFANTVPNAMVAGAAPVLPAQPATPEAAGDGSFHYRLYVMRQADLENNPISVTVTAPAGWKITGTSAWERYSSTVVATATDGSKATLSTPLAADLIMDVTLVKG